MAQLTQWVPDNWRQALSSLRENIHHALDRWLHHQRPETSTGVLVPRRVENGMDGGAFWPALWPSTPWPALDIEETDDALLVTAELPGFDRDDFTVEVTGERLVIRGEKKQTSTRNGQGYTYTERRYGAFARAMRLPCEVETDKAQATYKNGILRLTLPKTARARASRVKVRVRG